MKFLTLFIVLINPVLGFADPTSCSYKEMYTACGEPGQGCYTVEPGEHSDQDDDEQERAGIFGNKEDGQWCARDGACLSGVCEKKNICVEWDKDGNCTKEEDRNRCVPKTECMFAPPGEKAPGSIQCDTSDYPFMTKNSENICVPDWEHTAQYSDLNLIGSTSAANGACALNLQTDATNTYLNNFIKLMAFEHLFYRSSDPPNEDVDCFGMAKKTTKIVKEFKDLRIAAGNAFSSEYKTGYIDLLQEANGSNDSLKLQCLPPRALRNENSTQMKLNKTLIIALKKLYDQIEYLRKNYTWRKIGDKTYKNDWKKSSMKNYFDVPVWGDGGEHDCRRRGHIYNMSKAWHHRMKLKKNALDDVNIQINGTNINQIYSTDDDKAVLLDPFFPEYLTTKDGDKIRFSKSINFCGKEKFRRKCDKDDMKKMQMLFEESTKNYFKASDANALSGDAAQALNSASTKAGMNFLGITLDPNLESDPLRKILADETLLALFKWSYNSRTRVTWKAYAAGVGAGAAIGAIGAGVGAAPGAVIGGLATLYKGTMSPSASRYKKHYISNRIEYLNNLELAIVEMIVYLEKVNQLRFQVATCYNGVIKDQENICNPQGNGLGNGTDYTQGGEEQATGSTGHINKKDKKVTVGVTSNKLGGLKLNSAAMLDDKKFGSGLGKNLDEATLTSNIGDQLASDLKKRYQDSISKLNDKDKAFIDALSKAKKADFMRLQEATLKPDGNSSGANNKQGAVGIVAAPSKEEKKDLGPVASTKPAAKGAPAAAASPKFDFGLDKDSSGGSSSSAETTNHEETDAMLSETKSDKYKSDENDDLFTSISKAYVREGFPRLLKRKSSLEKTETQKTENKGLDKIQDLE